MIFGKKSKPTPPAGPAVSPSVQGQKSTQEWMPVKDVYNGFIHRRDGGLICAIRVQPINMNLLSPSEKRRKVRMLEEVFNGIDYSFQIISIARPVDLDAYIAKLQHIRSQEENPVKNRLLGEYISQAASVAVKGEALDRHFYILLDEVPTSKKHQSEAILIRRATELVSSLTSADLSSHICSDEELRDLLFIFTHPTQAAYERAPQTNVLLPPLFEMRE